MTDFPKITLIVAPENRLVAMREAEHFVRDVPWGHRAKHPSNCGGMSSVINGVHFHIYGNPDHVRVRQRESDG